VQEDGPSPTTQDPRMSTAAHPLRRTHRLRPARAETRNALSSLLRLARVPLRRRPWQAPAA